MDEKWCPRCKRKIPSPGTGDMHKFKKFWEDNRCYYCDTKFSSSPAGINVSSSSTSSSQKTKSEPDTQTRFIERLVNLYGDYVLHMAQFKSNENCEEYLSKLSFLTGTNFHNVTSPSYMKLQVEMNSIGPLLLIGGQFKKDENFEILTTLEFSNAEHKSMLVANEGTLVYKEFLEASKMYKEFVAERKKKSWWKFW